MTLREKMGEHILYLCLLFEIEWDSTSPLLISCAEVGRTIRTPPIHGQTQYFTALHEIAHILLGHVGKRDIDWWGRVEEEAEAWLWAFTESIVPPNPGVRWDVCKIVKDYRMAAFLRTERMEEDGPNYRELRDAF